jgi:hypothetical protein
MLQIEHEGALAPALLALLLLVPLLLDTHGSVTVLSYLRVLTQQTLLLLLLLLLLQPATAGT